MAKAKKGSGLSPEQIERIKAAQKRHAAFDPGCERWTPEEFINWHPIGGITMEERLQRMRERGIIDAKGRPIKKGKKPQPEVSSEVPVLVVSG